MWGWFVSLVLLLYVNGTVAHDEHTNTHQRLRNPDIFCGKAQPKTLSKCSKQSSKCSSPVLHVIFCALFEQDRVVVIGALHAGLFGQSVTGHP